MKYDNEYLRYDDIGGLDEMSLRDLPVTDLDALHKQSFDVVYTEPSEATIDALGLHQAEPGEPYLSWATYVEDTPLTHDDLDHIHNDVLGHFQQNRWADVVDAYDGTPELGDDDPLDVGVTDYTVVAQMHTRWKRYDRQWRLVCYEFEIQEES